MTHSKQWSSATPGLLIFLVDQSGSMLQTYKDTNDTRTIFATRVVNRVINDIITKNFNGTQPKDRCFIAAIGYSVGAREECSGYLSQLYNSPKRFENVKKSISDGAGGLVVIDKNMPIWVEPTEKDGWTDMAQAFRMAKEIIESWINDKPDSPAPVIINISDGIPFYGRKDSSECAHETAEIAKEIMNINTSDGNVLIFNAEIGDSKTQIILPNSINDVKVGGQGAEFLYEISSEIPEGYKTAAIKNGLDSFLKDGSRGAVFAADAEYLIKLIDFGSSKGQRDE
ncbi:MAG: VWA domain-containing protein [Muribaculaceae bacterium]|nr:VWA domain-containing protein [Muribaculaceae bacterium]